MDHKYRFSVRQVTAKPRSKRLRELGGTIVGSGGVSISVEGSKAIPNPHSHKHSNLDVLERVSTDDQDYICLNEYVEEEDNLIVKKERAKVGFADLAGALDDKALEAIMSTLKEMFLRKDQPDNAAGLITFLKGLSSKDDVIIGSKGYAEGMTGFGTKFSRDGSGEMSRLTLRHELRVPSLVFNQTEVNVGDKWRAPGGGCIERVMPDVDAQGNILNTGTFWLKLEKGQIGAVFANAICMGIFHDWENTDNNATEDSDDSRGNRTYAGFTTSYFTITEISDYTDEEGVTYSRKQCRYQIRPVSDRWSGQAHPYEQMNFVCYGVFSTDKEQLKKYGTSVYETRTYRRMLWNQNTWEIASSNIAYQDGDLSNLNIHGMTMDGYSAYLNSVYFTGTVKQVKPDGTPIQVVNDRREWKPNTPYAYYDRVSWNGGLWLCVNENGTSTEPSDSDSSWLCQVKPGSSIKASGRWDSSKVPYSVNSIVTFAEKVWISNKETSEPPFGTYTDKDGNRLIYKDGGYVLVDTLIQSEDWDLLLDAPQLTDGKDGESLQARYSSDKSNWHSTFTEGDVWMQQRVGEKSIWSDPIRIVGEKGAAGVDGTYYDYQFAVNDSLDVAPSTGWQDTPPTVGKGQYLWMRTRFVDPNSTEETSWTVARIGGEKGEKGDSVSNLGAWKIGMAVPYLGMVTMGGKTFMAKVATNNPPMWCWTDKDGNRFIYSDGGYILTGEMNTAEYDLVMQNGKDGRDGKDYEYIYIHTKDNNRPSTPSGEQTDDYVPSGWHDDPLGVTETQPYEWVCVRTKKDGIWSVYSTPAIWAKFGKDGIDGLNGLQGEKGEQGIPGENGKDGQTSYFHIKYANDANGGGMNESGGDYIGTYVDFTQADSTDPKKYTWVKTKGAQGDKGDQGIPGTNGTNGETSYLHIAYANSADGKTDFSVSDSTGKLYIGQYTDFVLNDSTDPTKYKWTLIKGEKGKDGEGFTMMGNWMSGMAVPKMGVVTMGGECFAAKVATTNPPLWCWTDKDGNRLVFSATEYILTGEMNTAEYERWSVKGADGKDGKDGKDGANGKDGKDGADGKDGQQGIQGCIIRDSEWVLGVEYHNDETLTSGTRYVDVALVRNDSAATGWDAYKCKLTHTSTADKAPGNATYWEEFPANMTALFTSLIIAKNAKITFLQGNQLLMQKNDGTVTAGLSGSEEGEKVRIWSGSDIPDNAPFNVTEKGVTTATKFRTGKSGLRLEAENGLISVFGNLAKNIEFGVDDEGLAVMRYFDNDGVLLYDLGPNGISSVKRDNDKWVLKRLTYLGLDEKVLFGDMWNTAKNPYYNTGTDRFQFLSGYVGGAYNDLENNRKIFNTQSKTNSFGNSNVVAEGWYCDTLPEDAAEYSRMQFPILDGILPEDMNVLNPTFNTSVPVYVTPAFYIKDGLIIGRMNVYYNLITA